MNNKKIAGADISRGWIVLCVLETFPAPSVLGFWDNLKTDSNWNTRVGSRQINHCMYRLETDKSGADLLATLGVEAFILEPTGIWYASFWVDTCEKLGIPIFWISHLQVKIARTHYRLKNKDDRSDALAIASLWFDNSTKDELGNKPITFNLNYQLTRNIREKFLEREQLDKLQTVLIQQLKQRLAREFPEILKRNFEALNKKGINANLGHITGKHKNYKFPENTAGSGIKPYTITHASRLMDVQSQILEIEQDLIHLLSKPDLSEYLQTLKLFGFGLSLQTLLMFQIYPLDRFFVNGRPYVRKGHDHSLRRFQGYLGLGYSYQSSGSGSADNKIVKKAWLGSDLVRSHLFASILVTICNPRWKAKTDIQAKLKKAWLEPRVDPQTGKISPSFQSLGKDGVCRLLFYETRILYQELKRRIF